MDLILLYTWHPTKQQDPEDMSNVIDWTDVVPKSSIILYNFTLTSTGYWRKSTIGTTENRSPTQCEFSVHCSDHFYDVVNLKCFLLDIV